MDTGMRLVEPQLLQPLRTATKTRPQTDSWLEFNTRHFEHTTEVIIYDTNLYSEEDYIF